MSTKLHEPLAGKVKKPLDLFGFLFRYSVMIIVFGFFIMTMLIPFVLMMRQPDYEVHSMLKIDPVVSSLITKSEDPSIAGYYHDFVRTQSERINEYSVLSAAIQRLTAKQKDALFPPGLPIDDCVALLQIIMKTDPVPRTHLVNLSIHSPRKEGLAPMLNEVMDTFIEKIQLELEKKDVRRLDYLNAESTRLKASIAIKEQQLQDVSRRVLSSSFSESYNLWQQRVLELQRNYVKTYTARVQAENAYTYGQKAAAELKLQSLGPLVEEGVMKNDAIGFTSSWTYQQLQEMRKSIDGVTADNEDRKRVEDRMTAMRNYEKSLRSETRSNIDGIVYGKRDLELQQTLIAKQNSFAEAIKNEQDISDAMKDAMQASGENSAQLLHGEALAVALEHDRDLLFRMDTRIHELEAEARAPLRVTVEVRARDPKVPAGSNIKKLLMACVMLSFGSVAALFLAIELFDNRIRSAKNITHALGYPPTWPISKTPQHIPFETILSADPLSTTAKAIRSLATRLYREHEEHQAQIFLFSAVDHGSGTTAIVDNTARSLACQSDRVLVIDANLQEWEIADDEELEGTEALTDMPQLNLLDCIQQDPQQGYDRLLTFMPKASSRDTSRMMGELLKQVRTQYDFICIDTAPVLKSDLTEYLAVHSDVGVLISQGDSTLYRDLRRAAEILVRLEIPVLAPVLNWGGPRKNQWFERYLDTIPERLQRLGSRVARGYQSAPERIS